MTTDITAVLAGLDRYEQHTITRARTGLVAGMLTMEGTAKATGTYADDTGANRAGTVGYVPGSNDDHFQAAVAAVEAHSSGASAISQHAGDADGLTGVLTTPTAYAVNLETNGAGQRAYLEPALIQDMRVVTRMIADAVKG